MALFAARDARADQLKDFFGSYLSSPTIVNVYWEKSAAAWDTDVTLFGNPESTVERIDAFTQALGHSLYFEGLHEYGVNQVTVGQSMVLGTVCPQFGSPPPDTGTAASLIGSAVDFPTNAQSEPVLDCIQTALSARGLDYTQVVIVLLYPPQVQANGNGFCGHWSAYHKYSGGTSGGPYAVVPLACGADLGTVTGSMTHEMVEAITDTQDGLGWVDSGELINGVSYAADEAADLCQGPNVGVGESGPPGQARFAPFLQTTLTSNSQASNFWSNGIGQCVNGTFGGGGSPPAPPVPMSFIITEHGHIPANPVSVCGRGKNMGAEVDFYGSFNFWDLIPPTPIQTMGSCPFQNGLTSYCGWPNGPSTLYLSAGVQSPAGSAFANSWTAGNPLRLPTPDTTGFRDIGMIESCPPAWPEGPGICMTQMYIAGFDHDVSMAPGDIITYTVTDPATGLSATVPAKAPVAASAIVNVYPGLNPPVPGWIMFNGGGHVVAEITDSCSFAYPESPSGGSPGPIEGATISAGTAPFALNFDPYDYGWTVFPAGVSDAQGMVFANLVTDTAGQQMASVNAPLENAGVTLSTVNFAVHPQVTYLTPSTGQPMASQAVTVIGAGFAPPGQGPRTTVTVGGVAASNVAVSAGGTSVSFTTPVLSGTQPVIVSVDGVPSVPLNFNYGCPIQHCKSGYYWNAPTCSCLPLHKLP